MFAKSGDAAPPTQLSNFTGRPPSNGLSCAHAHPMAGDRHEKLRQVFCPRSREDHYAPPCPGARSQSRLDSSPRGQRGTFYAWHTKSSRRYDERRSALREKKSKNPRCWAEKRRAASHEIGGNLRARFVGAAGAASHCRESNCRAQGESPSRRLHGAAVGRLCRRGPQWGHACAARTGKTAGQDCGRWDGNFVRAQPRPIGASLCVPGLAARRIYEAGSIGHLPQWTDWSHRRRRAVGASARDDRRIRASQNSGALASGQAAQGSHRPNQSPGRCPVRLPLRPKDRGRASALSGAVARGQGSTFHFSMARRGASIHRRNYATARCSEDCHAKGFVSLGPRHRLGHSSKSGVHGTRRLWKDRSSFARPTSSTDSQQESSTQARKELFSREAQGGLDFDSCATDRIARNFRSRQRATRAKPAPVRAQWAWTSIPVARAHGVRALRLRVLREAGLARLEEGKISLWLLPLRRQRCLSLRGRTHLPEPTSESRTARWLRLGLRASGDARPNSGLGRMDAAWSARRDSRRIEYPARRGEAHPDRPRTNIAAGPGWVRGRRTGPGGPCRAQRTRARTDSTRARGAEESRDDARSDGRVEGSRCEAEGLCRTRWRRPRTNGLVSTAATDSHAGCSCRDRRRRCNGGLPSTNIGRLSSWAARVGGHR